MDNGGILKIQDNASYWFLRAASGAAYFDDFQYNNFVAIGDNEVELNSLLSIQNQYKVTDEILLDKYKNIFFEKKLEIYDQDPAHENEQTNIRKENLTSLKRSSSISATKTFNFVERMKIGDFVIVPNNGSNYFLLGFITSDIFDHDIEHINQLDFDDDELTNGYLISDFKKKRRIYWIKQFSANQLPDKLSWVKSAQQTIHNITQYADVINPIISSNYFYNNNFYSRIGVSTSKQISAKKWLALQNEIVNTAGDNADQIFQKTNVQSPGQIILQTISDNWQSIALVSGVLIGSSEIKTKEGLKIQGLIPYFLNSKKRKFELEKEKINAKQDQDLKDEEIKSKQLDNKIKEVRYKKSLLEFNMLNESAALGLGAEKKTDPLQASQEHLDNINDLGLTNSDVGSEMSPENQIDNLSLREIPLKTEEMPKKGSEEN